jgi:ABC-2 type transport system permease protein
MNGANGVRAATTRMCALMRVELLRLLSDRTSIGLIVLVPAVQLLLFGYAVNLTPRNISLAIAPGCDGRAEWIREAVADTASFRLIHEDRGFKEAAGYVSSGRALVAIDCSAAPDSIRLVADGSNPLEVRAAIGVLQSSLLEKALRSATPGLSPAPAVQWLYNPDSRTVWFLAPGLVGVIVMISMLMLGALTLVGEREQGSWEGLLSTPITALDALIGKLTPYILIAIIQAVVVILLARWLFDLPVRGDVTALVAASSLFALANLTLGFSLSALADSQTQAVQAAVFFYLPSMLLSGFMFPYESMPPWARYVGNTLPLTHFVRSARGVLLKGQGAREVIWEMWPVAVFALASAIVALAVFRRQLK